MWNDDVLKQEKVKEFLCSLTFSVREISPACNDAAFKRQVFVM
jgi:hypothetical protein